MKLLHPTMGTVNCIDDTFSDKNQTESSQHKPSDIQNLLQTHNTPVQINSSLKSHVRLPGISEILPSLYLCGAGVAIPIFLEKIGITCVINAAPELPDTPLPISVDGKKMIYLQIPVADKNDINISEHFDKVSDVIEQNRQKNGKTMVHCVAGVSRSATLVLAYLMKNMNMSLKDAFELVRRVRPQIHPNSGFVRQLICYEEQLFNKTSVAMVYKESLGCEIPDIYEMEYQALEQFYQKHRHLKLR